MNETYVILKSVFHFVPISLEVAGLGLFEVFISSFFSFAQRALVFQVAVVVMRAPFALGALASVSLGQVACVVPGTLSNIRWRLGADCCPLLRGDHGQLLLLMLLRSRALQDVHLAPVALELFMLGLLLLALLRHPVKDILDLLVRELPDLAVLVVRGALGVLLVELVLLSHLGHPCLDCSHLPLIGPQLEVGELLLHS